MKINNKYLSGLLAGVLTAGAVQGSGNEENMPGLGGNQTPIAQQQGENNHLSYQQMARLLAEHAYRNGNVDVAEVILNSVDLDGATIINAWANQPQRIVDFGGGEIKDISPIPEMKEEKPIAQKIAEENTAKTKLDPHSTLQVAQYMNTESIKEVQEVNSKFAKEPITGEIQGHGKSFNQLRKNPSPVTTKNYNLYSHIETQQIFRPNDSILPGMYQYIITYPVTKAEIEDWVKELQNKHTGNALKDGQKPIVFEYQLLSDCENVNPIQEGANDVFKIKAYWAEPSCHYMTYYVFKQFYNALKSYMGKKRIVFNRVNQEDRESIKESFDLTKIEIRSWLLGCSSIITYDRYLIKKEKYKDDNLYFLDIKISGKTKPEEQRRQLKILSMDKKVEIIDGVYDTGSLILEFLGNVKATWGNISINPNDLQKQRSVTFSGLQALMGLGNRKIYKFRDYTWKKDDISEKIKEYVQYVKDNNLEYLSGFVNFANKPSYLTDKEWRKVIVLTGMVEEIMNLIDQKFNEYEKANPYAAPAADPYGCDGYGCVGGYNPYREYMVANC